MAGNRYRQLHTVDNEITEPGTHSTGAETSHDTICNNPLPSPHFQHQAGRRCQESSSSQPTTQINISAGAGHSSQRPDTLQQEAFLPSDSAISDSPVSVETRDDDPGNNLQRPALDQPAEHTHPTWTDFYFRPLFLISLSVLLILMIAALEVLRYISQHNQGLVTASEHMHYIWTYGPTFVLTMVAALWGQLEQRARQIMPWCLLSLGDAPAQNSLMLNYVTSSMPGSLFRSFKRKHFLVSVGICGSLILRLMIIFAAGLLRLEYESKPFARVLSIEDIFDLRKTVNYLDGGTHLPVGYGKNYWALLKYGLPYPHGTTSEFAVQSFVSSDDELYDKLMGEMQVFESSLGNCDTFKFTYDTYELVEVAKMRPVPNSWREILGPWCYVRPGYPHAGYLADMLLLSFVNWTQAIYKCTNSTSAGVQDHRILFTLEHWLNFNESEVSAFICEPKYSLTRRTLTNSTRYAGFQDSLDVNGEIVETLDLGIQPFNITDNIVGCLGGHNLMAVVDFKWSLWYTMLNLTQPQNDLWSFRNASLVIELSQRMWKGFAAYVVKQHYTIPSKEIINGTVTSTQARLCLQELSLRLVEAHITLLLALIVTLCFFGPGMFQRNPTSLGAHAMILARSPGLMNHLQGYGMASKQALRASFSAYLASYPRTFSPESPTVVLCQSREGAEELAEKPAADNSDLHEWWSPVSVRWWFRICLMAAMVALVTVLEVLLQVSDRQNGLGDVSLGGYLKYTWSFLPTLVLVLVGLLFAMVDSTARTLHSFQLLRRGRATMESMLHDPARHVSLIAIVYAAWKGHFALLWATLPALLAPILTIVASGLYTVAPVPLTYDTELRLKDRFQLENRTLDPNDSGLGAAGEAWTVFTLTQFYNMSYPKWTHGEYALASFETDNLHSHNGEDASLYITTRVPASRANPNCSLIEHYPEFENHGKRCFPVDPRPLGCYTQPEWNRTAGQRALHLSSTGEYPNVDGIVQSTRGYYLDLLEQFGCHDDTTVVCGDGRKHYFIGLGYGTEELSLLHCMPYVEALWVAATFSLPDLSLATNFLIKPDGNSAVFLSESATMTALVGGDFEYFAMAMFNGSSGVGQLTGLPPGSDNNDTRRLIVAVESTLSNYFAQILHFNYRQPASNNRNVSALSPGQKLLIADGHPINGTVTDRTRLRLIQNTVSTRILEGLLAVMGACLVASTALGRGARVIPRDPGSVASRMAYFAGGEVWRRVPVGADRWTDEQIRKHGLGVSDGRLLLAWWGGDGREVSEEGARGKRFAVDVVGCKEAA